MVSKLKGYLGLAVAIAGVLGGTAGQAAGLPDSWQHVALIIAALGGLLQDPTKLVGMFSKK